MKKVYFAGSIRGGREFVDVYMALIQYLKTKFIVLTEHLGDKNLGSQGEIQRTNEEIFIRDHNWIDESDFIVAEVTNPSLGVGYEIGYAESISKPILCLFQKSDKRVSAMIAGNKALFVREYSDIEDAKKIIDEFNQMIIGSSYTI